MSHTNYSNTGPAREDLDSSSGLLVVEFGTDWCAHCKAAALPIEEALSKFPNIQHLKIEDGAGRRLGRSFAVKLWPTLIFLKDGVELARLIRPLQTSQVLQCIHKLTPDI